MLWKIIGERDIVPALERGISTDWFYDPANRTLWDFILNHYNNYGVVPTKPTVRDALPGIPIHTTEESFDYLLDAFCKWRRAVLFTTMMERAADLVSEDPEAAIALVNGGMGSITLAGGDESNDVDLTETVDARIEEYLALRDSPDGLRGIPTGFPTIDKATLGLQPGQLVTTVAIPKAGKSTLALLMAIAAQRHGVEAMLVTFEMAPKEMETRHDAIVSQVPHFRLLTGKISGTNERTLKDRLEPTKDLPSLRVINDPNTATLSGLAAKCEKYKPSVLFVDGVYLMRDEETGEHNTPIALTHITRGLKRLAQRLEIPIVIFTQALTWKVGKAKGVTADSIGYCVDEETEILTEDGWRRQDQIDSGDVVLTLNHETGLSEWQPMLSVNRFPAMPRTLSLMEGQSHSSLTTGQHRWPVLHHYTRRGTVGREWRTTETLNSADYLITAAECEHLPTERKYSDALVALVAWFWTEGHINGTYGNVGITQSHRVNPDHVRMIESALTAEFGPEHSGPIPRNGRRSDGIPRWRVNVRDKGISEFWLSVDAGRRLLEMAPDKIPSFEFIRALTRTQLHRFIQVSMLADNNGARALSQKDRRAAEAFQFACTLAGINTSLTQSADGMWRVGMRRRQVVTPVASARLGRRFSITQVEHDGMIWCPTTRNRSWLARRSGQVYFTGNSSSFFQDSDVIIGLDVPDDDDDALRLLKIVRARNCGKVETDLTWDWSTMQFHERDDDAA